MLSFFLNLAPITCWRSCRALQTAAGELFQAKFEVHFGVYFQALLCVERKEGLVDYMP